MAETIFVGHTPGTYKVYNTIGGWSIMYLQLDGNSRNVDGGKVYKHRQNAYRQCKHLNGDLKFCRKAGIPIKGE